MPAFVAVRRIVSKHLCMAPIECRVAFAVTVAVLGLSACTGDPAAPERPRPSSAILAMPSSPQAPGALVRVFVRGGVLPAQAAPTLDGAALSASRTNDTTFVFSVPSVSVGNRSLSLLLADGSRAVGTLPVAAPVSVADPTTFLEGVLGAAAVLLDGVQARGVPASQLAAARQHLDSMRTQMRGLSTQQRTQLAQTLAANAALLPGRSGPSSRRLRMTARATQTWPISSAPTLSSAPSACQRSHSPNVSAW